MKSLFTLSILMSICILSSCKKDSVNRSNSNFEVSAGNDTTIYVPSATAFLQGTIVSSTSPVSTYQWSMISGPNVPAISYSGNIAAQISGLQIGVYSFRLLVNDVDGLMADDTVSVTVANTNIIQAVIPDLENKQLNFAYLDGFGNRSARDIDLDAGAWTIGGSLIRIRGSLAFDMSQIPAGAVIESASLSLYSNPTPINGNIQDANSGSNNAFYIYRNTSPWDAYTSGWQTMPSTTNDDAILIPHTNQLFLDLPDIDVTAMVRKMQTEGNYGFIMKLQDETYYTIRQFASIRHTDATKHQKLVVRYRL